MIFYSSVSILRLHAVVNITRNSRFHFLCFTRRFFCCQWLHDDVENHRHVKKCPSLCTLNKLTIKYHQSIIIVVAEERVRERRNNDTRIDNHRDSWEWKKNRQSFVMWVNLNITSGANFPVGHCRWINFIIPLPVSAGQPESDGFLNTRWFIINVDSHFTSCRDDDGRSWREFFAVFSIVSFYKWLKLRFFFMLSEFPVIRYFILILHLHYFHIIFRDEDISFHRWCLLVVDDDSTWWKKISQFNKILIKFLNSYLIFCRIEYSNSCANIINTEHNFIKSPAARQSCCVLMM